MSLSTRDGSFQSFYADEFGSGFDWHIRLRTNFRCQFGGSNSRMIKTSLEKVYERLDMIIMDLYEFVTKNRTIIDNNEIIDILPLRTGYLADKILLTLGKEYGRYIVDPINIYQYESISYILPIGRPRIIKAPQHINRYGRANVDYQPLISSVKARVYKHPNGLYLLNDPEAQSDWQLAIKQYMRRVFVKHYKDFFRNSLLYLRVIISAREVDKAREFELFGIEPQEDPRFDLYDSFQRGETP